MSDTATVFTGTVPTLKAAINALYSVCPKWYNIGVQLEVPTFQLKNIEKKTNDSMDQLRDTLDYWISNDPSPSWKHLVKALKAPSVGEKLLAVEIEERYCDPEETSCKGPGASVNSKHHQGICIYAFFICIESQCVINILLSLQKFLAKAAKKQLQKTHLLLLHLVVFSI